METAVSAPGVRQLMVALHRGDLILSDSGGQHVEGVADGNADVVHHGGLLRIRAQSGTSVQLAVPAGTDLRARVRGGAIVARVPLGSVRLATTSGDIRLESVSGNTEVVSDSGDIDVTESHTQATVRSGSGDVTIGRSDGGLRIRTGSGDITVVSNSGQALLGSGSGDVTVGVPDGVPTWLDLKTWSGSISVLLTERQRPAEDSHALVQVASGSGDIRIVSG